MSLAKLMYIGIGALLISSSVYTSRDFMIAALGVVVLVASSYIHEED